MFQASLSEKPQVSTAYAATGITGLLFSWMSNDLSAKQQVFKALPASGGRCRGYPHKQITNATPKWLLKQADCRPKLLFRL